MLKKITFLTVLVAVAWLVLGQTMLAAKDVPQQRTWQAEEANQRAMMELLGKPIPEDEEECIDLCLELAGRLELAKKWLDGTQFDSRHTFGEHADAFQAALDSAKMAFNGKFYKRAAKKYLSAAENANWIHVHLPMRERAERDLKALADNAPKLGGTDEYQAEFKSIEAAIGHVTKLLDEGKIEDALKEIGEAQALIAKLVAKWVYMVIDLRTWKIRHSVACPDLSDDTCRTTELWLRWIPAGSFTMGSPEGELGRDDGETQHQVTLTQGFYIGVFEVTQRQYELITGRNPSEYKEDTRPVERVSYDDIRGSNIGAGWPSGGHAVDDGSFLGKLRAKTGLEFDLPTEAQWEYACRAGTATALNSGKNLTNTGACPNMAAVGRFAYNCSDGKGGYGEHAKVGCYLPNAWGLYDMHGNVAEWCLDWDGDYPSEVVSDPTGAATGAYRVPRGGNWYSSFAQFCRSACRGSYNPSYRDASVGFRLVCPP